MDETSAFMRLSEWLRRAWVEMSYICQVVDTEDKDAWTILEDRYNAGDTPKQAAKHLSELENGTDYGDLPTSALG